MDSILLSEPLSQVSFMNDLLLLLKMATAFLLSLLAMGFYRVLSYRPFFFINDLLRLTQSRVHFYADDSLYLASAQHNLADT